MTEPPEMCIRGSREHRMAPGSQQPRACTEHEWVASAGRQEMILAFSYTRRGVFCLYHMTLLQEELFAK